MMTPASETETLQPKPGACPDIKFPDIESPSIENSVLATNFKCCQTWQQKLY